MTSPTRRTLLLLGLPRTGKSTYLGSLWQLIQDERDRHLVEVDVSGDRGYLQSLGEQVAAAEEVRRTDVDSTEGLEITLAFDTNGEISLQVPDLSGETLRLLVEDRTWPPQLYEALQKADALLLFIHPSEIRAPVRVDFTAELLAEFMTQRASGNTGDSDVSAEDTASSGGPLRFAPRMACTAAKLVDALENVLELRSDVWPLRVGVVVSAWDTVDGDPTPNQWLGRELPALQAFAVTNKDRLAITTFGVSAQGGQLPGDRNELLGKGSVFDRCFACDGTGRPVPLSAPLEWALFQ